MFHHVGDPNGRHNLPGAPMLDPFSAALMLLGLVMSLWYLRSSSWFIMPIWLVVMLLAGILSLDFEAPQSLRAVGTLPAAYILAAMPLHLVGRAWFQSDGRYYPQVYGWLLVLLLLPIYVSNVRTYFGAQAYDFAVWNAFSTPETVAAKLLSELDSETEPYVISYYHGHPTLNFLNGFDRGYQRLETTDQLPLNFDTNRNALLIMDGESKSLFDAAKALYPTAEFEEHRPPFGGPTIVYAAHLSRADLTSIQGLTASYYANAGWAGMPTIVRREHDFDLDWGDDAPLRAPFTVEWNGVLRIADYGLHQFFVDSSGPVELLIDGAKVVEGGEPATAITLARGNHTIRLRTAVPDVNGESRLQIAWRPPDRGPEYLPASVLYAEPVAANGLLGRYFANDRWQAPEAFAQIDPLLNLYFHIIPLPRPYTVEWSGKIAIPQDGIYRFGLESIDESVLYINEQEITAATVPNRYAEGEIALADGLHDIRIRYADRTDHTHINLYWTPPWGRHQEIPTQVLFPPQAEYDHVELPRLSTLQLAENAPILQDVANWPHTKAEVIFSGLNQPKGATVGPDGRIYVADTGNRRVLIFDADGAMLKQINGPGEPIDPANFVEPFDVAVSAAGILHVLDADTGLISRYQADGRFDSLLPIAADIGKRSRGIDIDNLDNVWIARTTAGRVLSIAPDGTLVRELPVWPGEDSQPVDVAVLGSGAVYVVDSGMQKLVRFNPQGQRLLAWDIPVANTIDASHLMVDATDRLLMSYPEVGEIARRNIAGEQDAGWRLQVEGARIVKPIGVGVDPDGSLWAVDTYNGTLLKVVGADE